MNEQKLRKLIREALLLERMVTIDWGEGEVETYDVDPNEIRNLRTMLRTGGDAAEEFASLAIGEEPPDRQITADNAAESVAKLYADVSGYSVEELTQKCKRFQEIWSSNDWGTTALVTLAKAGNPQTALFQNSVPAPGQIIELKSDMDRVARVADSSKALGQGEIASTLMFGGMPDPGGKAAELDVLLGDGADSGWHVKYMATEGSSAKWGPLGTVTFLESLRSQLSSAPEELAILEGHFNQKEFPQKKIKAAAAANPPQWYQGWGDCIDKAVSAAAGNAGSNGMLALVGSTFYFVAAEDVRYASWTERRFKVSPSAPAIKDYSFENKIRRILPNYEELPVSTACSSAASKAEKKDVDNTSDEPSITTEDLSTIRAVIKEALISEELNKTDKKEIERIAKKQAKILLDKELEKALGTSFFGYKGKVNKFVSDEISQRFKAGDKDKDFTLAVEKVAKRVLQALYTMHYKRRNLIKDMPVPKS